MPPKTPNTGITLATTTLKTRVHFNREHLPLQASTLRLLASVDQIKKLLVVWESILRQNHATARVDGNFDEAHDWCPYFILTKMTEPTSFVMARFYFGAAYHFALERLNERGLVSRNWGEWKGLALDGVPVAFLFNGLVVRFLKSSGDKAPSMCPPTQLVTSATTGVAPPPFPADPPLISLVVAPLPKSAIADDDTTETDSGAGKVPEVDDETETDEEVVELIKRFQRKYPNGRPGKRVRDSGSESESLVCTPPRPTKRVRFRAQTYIGDETPVWEDGDEEEEVDAIYVETVHA